jgi:hypothetical protein
MKKEITIREFAAELIDRIDKAKEIGCCKEELKNLAVLAREKMPDEKIVVNWKEA